MHAKNSKHIILEKLTKIVPKWSQHLSKIDLGGALEASWEPPLQQDASKTSFLAMVTPFRESLWDQFGLIFGIIVYTFFEVAF